MGADSGPTTVIESAERIVFEEHERINEEIVRTRRAWEWFEEQMENER